MGDARKEVTNMKTNDAATIKSNIIQMLKLEISGSKNVDYKNFMGNLLSDFEQNINDDFKCYRIIKDAKEKRIFDTVVRDVLAEIEDIL